MGNKSCMSTRLRIILAICCCLSLLAGCHNSTGEREFGSNANDGTAYNGNKAIKQGLEVTEKGYYYLANDILYFYDIANDLSMPMCSRTECAHKDKSCDAYARSIYTQDDFSWQCDGKELMLYQDSLCMIEHSKENEYYIVQYDMNFNNKKIIVQLSDFKNKLRILSAYGAYAIYHNYLYYCVYDYSEAAVQKDYIFKFYCMRIKLEQGAVPEQLGEFSYPGDYVMAAGDPSGINVMCHEDNVYYFASCYRRVWVHENDEQCAVMRYNIKTGEFTSLYSSASGWDSGIGKIDGYQTCIDADGVIYAIADGVNIVAINPESGEKKKIYSFAYHELGDGLSSLVYDGEYLYFIAVNRSSTPMSTCIKAIDTAGKEVGNYEFKVNAKYRDENGNAQDAGHLRLLGLDNRNLVILSTSSAYENLSTDKELSRYDTATDMGVGLIPLSDFLEGKDITIKQIYKY